jgi:hypothetical protein
MRNGCQAAATEGLIAAASHDRGLAEIIRWRLPPRRRRPPRVAVQALFRSRSVIAPMQAAGTSHEYQ